MRQAKPEGSIGSVGKGLQKKEKDTYILRLYIPELTHKVNESNPEYYGNLFEQLRD